MKGQDSQYRPTVGTVCLISGPNCDDDRGYTYGEYTILWRDATFVLYGKPGCHPNLEKWNHVHCKPVEPLEPVLFAEHCVIQTLAAGLQTWTSNRIYLRVAQMIKQLGGFPRLQTEDPDTILNVEYKFILTTSIANLLLGLKDPKALKDKLTWKDETNIL